MGVETKGRTIILTGKAAEKFNEQARHPSAEAAEKRDRYLNSLKSVNRTPKTILSVKAK